MNSLVSAKAPLGVYLSLICLTFLLLIHWFYASPIQSRWTNVPPAQTKDQLSFMFLNDQQLAYRAQSLMVQNLGDHGGRTEALDNYNYEHLYAWFSVLSELDPVSNFMPVLAGYYFGASKKPENLRAVILFLKQAGSSPDGEKWRWLAQAVFLARYDLEDLDLALELANQLADMYRDDMPAWSKQMPVLIMAQMGRKDAALILMVEILRDHGDKMHPNEVNFMRYYICERLLNTQEAASNPLCEGDY